MSNNEHGRVDIPARDYDPYRVPMVQTTAQSYYTPPRQEPPRQPKRHGIAGIVVACTLGAALLGGAVGGVSGLAMGYRMAPQESGNVAALEAQVDALSDQLEALLGQQGVTAVPASSSSGTLSVAQIAAKAAPSVVAIDITATQRQMTIWGETESEVNGGGSGVIITEDGYIVTNNHVVEGAETITVYLSDGRDFAARLIGRDARTDIAILKIDANGLQPATIGSSADVKVGDMAIAIGNPLATLAGTVTQGIVSALEREMNIEGEEMTLMQVDAAVNPGNSGGALLNGRGELVGIVNAKSSAIGVEGIGFAIPIDHVKGIIDELVTNGYVSGRPWIGIETREVTPEIAQNYGMPEGIYVVTVEPYSAAEAAGILPSDVIISFAGQNVKTTDELNAIKEGYEVGDTLPIVVMRAGEPIELNITLMEENQR